MPPRKKKDEERSSFRNDAAQIVGHFFCDIFGVQSLSIFLSYVRVTSPKMNDLNVAFGLWDLPLKTMFIHCGS